MMWKDCTVLISVSYFEFSRKRGINLKLEQLSYKFDDATNDTPVKFVAVSYKHIRSHESWSIL